MKIPALILALLIIICSTLFVTNVFAEEVGTEANPENANDRYFATTKSYLINTDLAEGDSDGYWYEYTATGAGIVCIDASARDEAGNEVDCYQVTVECKGIRYYAYGEVYTRPIAPFRLSRGDVLTIHIIAKPNSSGVYPKVKVYCNITTVYGTENSPVLVKSDFGFVANVQSNKSVTYQDGTNGGLYGGKGIVVSGDKTAIRDTEVILNGVSYTDTDMDGTIELMLPGDPTAMIPAHPIFAIYNSYDKDASYVIKVVNTAAEDANVSHKHSFVFVENTKLPTVTEEGVALYVCTGCGEEKTEAIPTVERWKKGDINNDKEVNAIDTNLIKRVIVGMTISAQAFDAADVEEDGTVNAMDSYKLRCMISGIN